MKLEFDLPATAGISLKPEHFDDVFNSSLEGLWFEIHAENYLIDGGPRLDSLKEIAMRYPLSVHGVGASLAGPRITRRMILSKVCYERLGRETVLERCNGC